MVSIGSLPTGPASHALVLAPGGDELEPPRLGNARNETCLYPKDRSSVRSPGGEGGDHVVHGAAVDRSPVSSSGDKATG